MIRPPCAVHRLRTCECGGVKAGDYRIVVEGELGPRYAAAFDSMQLDAHDGITEIAGRIEDQAQLRGLLDEVSELGLSLVSVTPDRPS